MAFHKTLSMTVLVEQGDSWWVTFLTDAIASWNTFIGHFTNIPSYNILKTHLLSFFRPPKRSIFNIHDPTGIRFLFQLRLGLSPLRSHKRRHGFVDTPSEVCLCNTDVEDTKHFLFKFPFHAMKRASLATEVVPILIKNNLNRMSEDEKLYLYGNDPWVIVIIKPFFLPLWNSLKKQIDL